MPHYKCCCCHHEFDYIPYETEDKRNKLCDWCGAPTYILEEKTPLEKFAIDVEEAGGWEEYMKKMGIIYDKDGNIRQH